MERTSLLLFITIQFQQLNNIRDQMNAESCRNREIVETTNCRLRTEELEKTTLEDRLGKLHNELQQVKSEHFTVNFKRFIFIW